MSSIWFEDGAVELASYSSNTKGTRREVRIVLRVTDTYSLGDLLRQLDELQKRKGRTSTGGAA